MEVVDQVFQRGIKQFRGQNHAAIEQEQGPPHQGRFGPGEHDEHKQGGQTLQAEARFHAEGSAYALQGKSHALEEKLILHGN